MTAQPATRRRAKGAEREQAVVAAAAELIAERGLANVRVADVADRAGMSVGHVTYYFPSKSVMLMRAIRLSEQRFQAEVEAALSRRRDPWDRLRSLIASAGASVPGDAGWLLWFEVWAHAGSEPDVADAQRDLYGWWRTTLADVVAYGVEQGSFHPDDPDRAVAVLSALTDGLSVQLTLGAAGATRRRLLDLVMSTAHDLLDPDREAAPLGG